MIVLGISKTDDGKRYVLHLPMPHGQQVECEASDLARTIDKITADIGDAVVDSDVTTVAGEAVASIVPREYAPLARAATPWLLRGLDRLTSTRHRK